MAGWGLTEGMRESRPWGLDSDLLHTEKVITDPVQGDIFVTRLERLIIDTPPFQRLRRVRQLGATHYVYPGATHTRFAHSLGSLMVSQKLMDAVLDQHLGPHPEPRDLFAEWLREFGASDHQRRIAEATVLARLGGLLHDLTHVPFGHSIEDDLGLLVSHDENLARFEHYWAGVMDGLEPAVRSQIESEGLDHFLRPLVLSKYVDDLSDGTSRSYQAMVAAAGGDGGKAESYAFVADIVGNTICADLLDYLRRDHMFTGLPLAVGERYLSYFYVTPTEGYRYYPARMVLRIQRDGRERIDVITELLKHLRYRYELSERALVHHAKLAADAMVGKALAMWHDAVWADIALPQLGDEGDPALREDATALRSAIATRISKKRARRIDDEATLRLEEELRRRGDDGFLEWLADWSSVSVDNRGTAIEALVDGLLNRRLFKPVAHLSDVGPGPEETYRRYQQTDDRRKLEQGAARFAEIRRAWRVLVWIPEPRMRLKIAEVLVDTGSGIKRFNEESRGDRRGADIYEAHRRLWAVSVFVDPEIYSNDEQVEAVLAYLASELEVRIPSLGLPSWVNPWDTPDFVAARRVTKRGVLSGLRGAERDILEMLRQQRHTLGAVPGDTITARVGEVELAAEAWRTARIVLRGRFAPLAGQEAELYGEALEMAAYGGFKNRSARREAFRAAADALMAKAGTSS